jgi:hypothetical protein
VLVVAGARPYFRQQTVERNSSAAASGLVAQTAKQASQSIIELARELVRTVPRRQVGTERRIQVRCQAHAENLGGERGHGVFG